MHHHYQKNHKKQHRCILQNCDVHQVVLAPLLHLWTSNLGLGATLLCLAALVSSATAFALLYKLPKDWAEGNGYRGISPSSSRRPSSESMDPSAAERATVSDTADVSLDALGEGDSKSGSKTFCACSLHLLLASHFLFNIGIFTAFSFTTDRAVQRGLNGGSSSLLLSLMGVSNCVGRVLFGLLLDRSLYITTNINNSHHHPQVSKSGSELNSLRHGPQLCVCHQQ